MRFLKWGIWLVVVVAVLLAFANTEAAAGKTDKEWTGKLWHGRVISKKNFDRIVGVGSIGAIFAGAHLRGANLPGARLRGANFNGANLSRANLREAFLERANLRETNFEEAILVLTKLSSAHLDKARLSKADMRGATLIAAFLNGADLNGANLEGTNFRRSDLTGADLSGAKLNGADLSGAFLDKTNLEGANLFEADLQGATFWDAEVSGLIFQSKLGTLPHIASISTAKGLRLLTYNESPHAMVELRDAFKNAGLRDQERQLTYAIKHNERIKTYSPAWSFFTYLLFELPCGWGMHPGRPLLIMLVLIPVFFIPHLFSLFLGSQNGIWKRWSPDRLQNRVRTDWGQRKQERLKFKWSNWRAYTYALYFSILSAFHIGWRDLNVGNWITRMQPREYTLRATGWVRTVSGIQSLLSVYLLALAILTYFGRPFG